MGGDAIEKPAVVADDDGATAEVLQRLFQGPEGVDVQVVGGLVQQNHVGPFPQHLGQMNAVALTAGQGADLFLLLGAREVESRHVGPGVDQAVAQFDLLVAAGDLLPDRFLGVELAILVDIGQLHGVTHADRAAVGCFLVADHLEQGGLAGAVGADDADDAPGRQAEAHLVDQQSIPERFAHVVRLDDHIAQPRPRRNIELQVPLALLGFLGEQLLVGVDTGLAFGMAPLGGHADPLQFARQSLLAGGFAFLFPTQALLLLFEPARVVAFPGDALAPVQLEDPAGHIVEEVAVVGHGDDRSGILLQVPLQPGHAFGIQVVGGFVQQQDVGFLQQQPAQGHAPLFAARQHIHRRIARRAAQCVHGHLQAGVQVPGIECVQPFLDFTLALDQLVHFVVVHRFGELVVDFFKRIEQVHRLLNALLHDLPNGFLRIHQRLLLQVAHRVARGEHRFAVEFRVHTGKDAQQRRFAGAVEPQDTDLGAVKVG